MRNQTGEARVGRLEPISLTSHEGQMQAELGRLLAPYEQLLLDCGQLASSLLNKSHEVQLPFRGKVLLILLTRLQGDLRVVYWAAISGYVIQAQALAAGIQELAHQAVFVSQSEEEAERWVRHDKHHQAYP